jgi:hypothetical protein
LARERTCPRFGRDRTKENTVAPTPGKQVAANCWKAGTRWEWRRGGITKRD